MKRHHLFSAVAATAMMYCSPATAVAGSGQAGGGQAGGALLLRGDRDQDSTSHRIIMASNNNEETRRLDSNDEEEDSGDENSGDENSADDEEEEEEGNANDDAGNEEDNADDDDAAAKANDDYAQYYDAADAWDDAAQEDQDYYDDADNNNKNSTLTNIKNKVHSWEDNVHTWESNAEQKWWEFYESPPSQWSTEQWDAVTGVICTLLASCFLGAAYCAYVCVKVEELDDHVIIEQMAPLSPPNTPKTPKSPRDGGSTSSRPSWTTFKKKNKKNKNKNEKNDYMSEYYERYNESLDDNTVDTELQSTTASMASSYKPPVKGIISVTRQTSLADYTSVQREKEAKIFEAWKESKKAQNEENDDDNDDNNDKSSGDDYDVFKEEYGARFNRPPGAKKSSIELDAALKKKDLRNDKLIEARNHQHNQAGYYL